MIFYLFSFYSTLPFLFLGFANKSSLRGDKVAEAIHTFSAISLYNFSKSVNSLRKSAIANPQISPSLRHCKPFNKPYKKAQNPSLRAVLKKPRGNPLTHAVRFAFCNFAFIIPLSPCLSTLQDFASQISYPPQRI